MNSAGARSLKLSQPQQYPGSYRMKSRYSTTFINLLTVWLLSLIQENLSCGVTPSDLVAIVGQKVSFGCNARPNNNESQGTVSKWRLGNEGTTGPLIYQPPVYGPNGKVNVQQFVAAGYFLSYADEDLINVTIQINETQMRHGGKYFCICDGSTSPVGTANLVVLEQKLKFIRNEEKQLIPGEMIYLSCSMLFNGTTKSALANLTILNATGELLANRSNLPLMQNVTSHHVTYTLIANRNEEQNFTCEMKVWTKSSDGQRMLYSSSSSLYFDWGGQQSTIEYEITPGPASTSTNIPLVAVTSAVGISIIVLVIFVVQRKRGRCHEREIVSNRREDVHNYGQPRYVETAEGGREITYAENSGFMAEEDLHQQKRKVDNELVVFDNAVYDASPRFDESRQYKVEQIYNEVL